MQAVGCQQRLVTIAIASSSVAEDIPIAYRSEDEGPKDAASPARRTSEACVLAAVAMS